MSWWETEEDEEVVKAPLLVLYHDKAAAMAINTAAVEAGFVANVAPVKQFLKAGFLTSPVVVVCTEGMDEDLPFVKLITTPSLPSDWLKGMHHCCVASTPSDAVARRISSRLSELGSHQVFAPLPPVSLIRQWPQFPDDDGIRPTAQLPKRPETLPNPKKDVKPTSTSTPNYADRTLTVNLVLEKRTERLGIRQEQSERDGHVYVTSVKKGSLLEGLGVQVGMVVFKVGEEDVVSEMGLQKGVEKLREAMCGVLVFRAPARLDFEDSAKEVALDPLTPQQIPTTLPMLARTPPSVSTLPLVAPKQKGTVVFMYASETGNAESICLDLNSETREKGWPTRVGKMNDFESLGWQSAAGGVVMVVSTSGDGEIPDNGKKFLRYLKKKVEGKQFPHVKYAMLALGDQNYDKFCGAGKALERYLEKAGCVPFMDTALADDGCGLEIVVEPFRAALPGKLTENHESSSPEAATETAAEAQPATNGHTPHVNCSTSTQTGDVSAAIITTPSGCSSTPNYADRTLTVNLVLEKRTERLGIRQEQSERDGHVYVTSVKKGSLLEGLGVQVGMVVFKVGEEDVVSEMGLQKGVEKLREAMRGVLVFRAPDSMDFAPPPSAALPQRPPNAPTAPPAPADIVVSAAFPLFVERTLLIHMVIVKSTDRLGMRYEKAEKDNLIYVTSVKGGSQCDNLGVKAGMQIVEVDGIKIAGENSLQKRIDTLRANLRGSVLFKVPIDVEFLDPSQAAPTPTHTTISGFPRGLQVPQTKRPVVFMYASETGNAESICLELNRETREKGWPTRVGKMNDFESLAWDAEEGGLIMVVSTTGDGEIPENGKKFLRYLKKKVEGKQFPHVKYAMLALGDQNYDKFCGAGKALERYLEKAGCVPFMDTALADDGCGLEIVVEPFRAALQEKLLQSNSLSAQNPYIKIRQNSERKVLIMYGSETGNAQAIARNIYEICTTSNITTEFCAANDFKKIHWESFPVLILVMATTGDGDVCSNAISFASFVNKTRGGDFLTGMRFTLLGLGNRSYPKFCKSGKMFHERLSELGATSFYASDYADDEVGLEMVVEPWKQKLWPALLSLWRGDQLSLSPSLRPILKFSPNMLPNAPPAASFASTGSPANSPPDVVSALGGLAGIGARTTSDLSSEVSYDLRHGQLNPFYAKLTAFTLMANVENTETYKLTFDVSEGGIEWSPGDAIGVCPCNDENQVDMILKRLNLAAHDDFNRPVGATAEQIKLKTAIYETIRFPLTNRQVLLRHVDLFIRKTDTLRYLANSCTDKSDREVLASWCVSSTRLFRDKVLNKRLTVVDVLEQFSSCAPEFQGLVEQCASLQPRYYSAASAMVVDPNRLDICFRVVNHRVGDRIVPGVSTNWMRGLIKSFERSAQTIAIPVFLKTTPEFSPPENVSSPVIMIGPGTGVAPFVAFLQYRAWQIRQAAEDGNALGMVQEHEGGVQRVEPHGEDADVAELVGQTTIVGESHLFFGCKSREVDYLFRFVLFFRGSQLFLFHESNISTETSLRHLNRTARCGISTQRSAKRRRMPTGTAGCTCRTR